VIQGWLVAIALVEELVCEVEDAHAGAVIEARRKPGARRDGRACQPQGQILENHTGNGGLLRGGADGRAQATSLGLLPHVASNIFMRKRQVEQGRRPLLLPPGRRPLKRMVLEATLHAPQ